MNFYKVEFLDGFTKEIKSLNDDQALKMANSIIRRWNQPGCTVYRTNPYNSNKKRKIGTIKNDQYNPEEPTLQKDPLHTIVAEKAEKKKRTRKTSSKKPSGNTGKRQDFKVPLAAIADKIGKNPAALRRKLRKLGVQKPEGGWGWDSWEDPLVQEMLNW